MKSRSVIFIACLVVAIFALFWSFRALDPDFGWHLQTGRLIWQNKTIPHIDWYSFSMPDFPWVNHEWMSDVLVFLVYDKLGGYPVLTLLFFFAILASFFITLGKYQLKYYFIPAFLGMFSLLPYAGVRMQIISWFLIALIAKIFFDKDYKNKIIIFFLPFVFLIWANLHAGFLLGLLIFGFAVLLKSVRGGQFQLVKKMIVVFGCSVAATLINPYGYRIYEEIWRTGSDSFLRIYILEWQGLFSKMHWPSFFYLALFAALALVFYKKDSFDRFLLSSVTLIMAVFSTRHFPVFIFISLPLITEYIEMAHHSLIQKRITKIKFALVGFAFFVFLMSAYLPSFPLEYQFPDYPSAEMIQFLKRGEEKRIFNNYSWGGVLINELPQRRFFIDGRMPSWRYNNVFAFGDYVDMVLGNHREEIIKKYQIEQFILPWHFGKSVFLLRDYIPAGLLKIIWAENKNKFDLVRYLEKAGEWQKVYQDQTGVVFEKSG